MIIEEVRAEAFAGDIYAQIELGDMYYYGMEVPVSYSNARMWYMKASRRGNSLALIKIGMMYEHGNGVILDLGEAETWYRKAKNISNPFRIKVPL